MSKIYQSISTAPEIEFAQAYVPDTTTTSTIDFSQVYLPDTPNTTNTFEFTQEYVHDTTTKLLTLIKFNCLIVFLFVSQFHLVKLSWPLILLASFLFFHI